MRTINCRQRVSAILLVFSTLLLAVRASAQTPNWIWHPNEGRATAENEVRFFRKSFSVEGRAQKAILSVAADNRAEVFLNGERVMESRSHSQATHTDVTARIKIGQNVLAISAANEGGPAALLARLELTLADGQKQFVVTDASWLASSTEAVDWRTAQFQPTSIWVAAANVGKLGDPPWGDPLKPVVATPAESLTVLPGFQVQLLHSAAPQEGSWICMTVDPKGRLVISPQRNDQPLLRVTLSGAGQVEKIESIPAPVRQAMGLCWAHNSLYVNGHGPNGTGLYRLTDDNRNDQFDPDEVRFLKRFQGEGEHGYHAVVEGPDGMIYVMNGNHTKVPEGVAAGSPHGNYEEDFLLPRQWDGGGHAVGVMAPGGYIVRTDRDGKKWELLLAGFRNAYDFDFNADGEIFTFDSDMEWDWGLPWYRPTRINHCVSGGEYGWRSGTGKWPDYYADSLPATVNIGIGSPTGVKFGTKSNYPEKYRQALFAMDWSYGRIIAGHLKPRGASYTGSYESFVKGKPLNVTDLEFGKDGAMYFITGGRGTQSGLYRVSSVGADVRRLKSQPDEKPTKSETPHVVSYKEGKTATEARALRRKLESFHGKPDPTAIDFAWPHLRSEDRFIRYAARIAIESQDVARWKDRALAETHPQAGLTALLALARCGGRETQTDLLRALRKFPFDSLTEEQSLEKLRLIQFSFIRQGRPSPDLTQLAIERLNRIYPSPSERMNRELMLLLVYLNAPEVVGKTLALLEQAPTREEQIHYIFHLRNVRHGWTIEQRRQYFDWFAAAKNADATPDPRRHPPELVQWFKEVDRDYSDGASYAKYLVNIRNDAIATLTTGERTALRTLLDESLEAPPWKPVMQREFVKEWTMGDLEPWLDRVSRGRDFKSGKNAFNDAQCNLCHRFGNEGGAIGPELTGVASKYSRRDILESLIEPSKVVSDQYQNFNLYKHDGDDVSGRIMDETPERLIVMPNMLTPEVVVELRVADIARRQPSTVSPMPSGLLNNLTREEILDLLAYIEAAGKPGAANFRK
jgi:putative heme-binding domain-containing protein